MCRAGSERHATDGAKHDLSLTLEQEYNPFSRKLDALEKPIVCAVNGVAAGAQVSLALAADVTFAAQQARFILAFVNIGLAPDCGATWSLPRLIGQQRAMALALSGETRRRGGGGAVGPGMALRGGRGPLARSDGLCPAARHPRPPVAGDHPAQYPGRLAA